MQAMRNRLADFMQTDEALNQLSAFEEQKRVTLASRKMTWPTYLQELRKPKIIWADELVLLSASLLFGKEINVLTTKQGGEPCWYTPYKQNINWPYPYSNPPMALGNLQERHYESLHQIETNAVPHIPPARPERVSGQPSLGPRNENPTVHPNLMSNEGKCKVCSKMCATVLGHLAKKEQCKQHYSPQEIKALQKKAKDVDRAKKAERSRAKRQDQSVREREAAAMRDKRQDPSFRAKERKRRRAKYKREMKKVYDNYSEYKRFLDFKDAIKDTWVIACLSCFRVLSTTAGRAITLDKLKAELGKSLFEKCIKPDACKRREFLDDEGRVLLCTSCDSYLRVKKQMPPLNYYNGMEITKIPDALKLTDLEATLVAKRILFIKMFNLVKSRWWGYKDHTTMVPVCDDTLLETYNKVSSFPRLPGEAGLVLVRLKRKIQYNNHHVMAYVDPARLRAALQTLKDQRHPSYTAITISNRFSVLASQVDADSSGNESDTEDEDEQPMDSIRENQLDLGSSVTLTDANPESAVVINQPAGSSSSRKKQTDGGLDIAPGEGKIPTNLARDPNWDIDAFPHLFPDGKYGLNHEREKKLSTLKYLISRLQSIDKRWCKNSAFLFAALYCIEREQLERQINISYMRGRVVHGSMVNLEDACHVLDNIPGTFRYWQQRRYEVLAKLEQLGPFQFFFTLSCADKRWDENFVSILSQKGLKIYYESPDLPPPGSGKFAYQSDEIWVQEEGKQRERLKDYLKSERLHELVRENVLSITMNFDKRVHKFMQHIVMHKSSPMKTQFYHYRVEFQARGAGHIHGVLWIDIPELEKMRDKEDQLMFKGLQVAMEKLKYNKDLTKEDKAVLAKLADTFVSCSLDDADLRDLVMEVQTHRHSGNREKKTGCYKKGHFCRFNYPRLPSSETIIATPTKRGEYEKDESERKFLERKKKYKETLQRVKELLVELSEDELNVINEETLLAKAGVSKDEYYNALRHSQVGACIVLKRKPSEVYINNYNPEWIKAWDGNMDIALCLDFFAIITYITDYYTKSETEMMSRMMDAAKACKGKERKDQLKCIVNAFLKYRVMGEMEAFYRVMPHLHLSESNLKCVFVATGFPENRSKFLMKMKDKLIDEDDDEESMLKQGIVTVPGKEGTYKQKIPIHDKYASRPDELENMCLAQFAIYYDTHSAANTAKKQDECNDDQSAMDDSEEDKPHRIMSGNTCKETILPKLIRLKKNLGPMRLRKIPAVLRIHKLKEDKNPHEFYYSQLLLYRPWREETELKQHDLDACLRLIIKRNNQGDGKTIIELTKGKLFPHKNNVEEARALMETLPNTRPTHTVDDLDAESQLENEADAWEEAVDDPEYAARYPNREAAQEVGASASSQSTRGAGYKPIQLGTNEERHEMARKLDKVQRVPFDLTMKYVKQLRTSQNSSMKTPKPPLLKIHGGAGAGKSFLINTIAAHCEYWMTVHTNKNPERPSVVKVAPTGKAANLIQGDTLHHAFNFSYDGTYYSLSDKLREIKRAALENLTVVIVDEMSMVNADLLYNLNL